MDVTLTPPDDAKAEEIARRRQEKLEALRRDVQAGRDSGSASPFNLEEILMEARRRFFGRLWSVR